MRKEIKRKEGLLERIMKGIKQLFKRELIRNKVYSVIMMIIGYFTIPLADGDSTAFIFMLLMALPVFFAKDNVVG